MSGSPRPSIARAKPTAAEYARAFDQLRTRWAYVAGDDLAGITEPYMFAGRKRRRLVVLVRGAATPPWGTWQSLSAVEAERRTFTDLRRRVNEVIAPHEVDHVAFREPSMQPPRGHSTAST